MPKKAKQTTQPTQEKEQETKALEQVQVQVQEQVKSERRVGRTLLVKSNSSNSSSSLDDFSSLKGLLSKSETKTSNSYFLNFDTVENSAAALETLEKSGSYNVKFSYYRVFFTMSGLVPETDYNDVKKQLVDYVSAKTGSLVLYCKFYRNDSKYLGCGDLTLDTLDGMNKLLSKEHNNKDYDLGSYSGRFYRYNGNKNSDKSKSANHNA